MRQAKELARSVTAELGCMAKRGLKMKNGLSGVEQDHGKTQYMFIYKMNQLKNSIKFN